MNNSASQHSKGWSGIAFCVLVIVTIVLGGMPPGADATPAAIAAYLAAHRAGLLSGAWLTLPVAAFFLWFAIGLRDWLRAGSDRDEGLPSYLWAFAIVTAAVAIAGITIESAMILRPSTDETGTFWALWVLISGAFLSMPVAVFIFAAALSMRRHATAPQWLAWLGYLSAVGQGVLSFGMLYSSGWTWNNPLLYAALSILPLLFIAGCSLAMMGVIAGKRAVTA